MTGHRSPLIALVAFVMALVLAPAGASAEGSEGLVVTNPQVTVCFQPLGDHDPGLLRAAERGVTWLYGFAVERLPHAPLPKAAWYAPRRRWRADKLLDHLRESKPARCTYVLGFTHRDISTTKGEHQDWGILGLGEVGGQVGVVSTWRVGRKLRKPHTRARRTVKVVNHEIGHILGLPHVKERGCLMQSAEGTVLTVDEETGLLCGSTIDYIEKTHGYRIPRRGRFEWAVVE